jgi:hypothetical protein
MAAVKGLNTVKPRYYTDEFFPVSTRETVCVLLVVFSAPIWWPLLVTYLVLRAIWWVATWAWDCLRNEVDLLRYYPQPRHKMSRRFF